MSRNLLMATGMMENSTDAPHTGFNVTEITLELEDVRDIAEAAHTSLDNIVDCVANVLPGAAAQAQAELTHALGGNVGGAPCLTVLETKGTRQNDVFN